MRVLQVHGVGASERVGGRVDMQSFMRRHGRWRPYAWGSGGGDGMRGKGFAPRRGISACAMATVGPEGGPRQDFLRQLSSCPAPRTRRGVFLFLQARRHGAL